METNSLHIYNLIKQKIQWRGSERAQWRKALAKKSDGLSSIPRSHMGKGEN